MLLHIYKYMISPTNATSWQWANSHVIGNSSVLKVLINTLTIVFNSLLNRNSSVNIAVIFYYKYSILRSRKESSMPDQTLGSQSIGFRCFSATGRSGRPGQRKVKASGLSLTVHKLGRPGRTARARQLSNVAAVVSARDSWSWVLLLFSNAPSCQLSSAQCRVARVHGILEKTGLFSSQNRSQNSRRKRERCSLQSRFMVSQWVPSDAHRFGGGMHYVLEAQKVRRCLREPGHVHLVICAVL